MSKILSAVLGVGVGVVLGLVAAKKVWKADESADEPPLRLNNKQDLQSEKIVNIAKVSDIPEGGKAVYCRCWKSDKFPLCDGAHVKHNKETGDNVGPLIVSKAP